jgi:hypothetical protein
MEIDKTKDKTKDIGSLLSFFDPIKFDHVEVGEVIYKVLNIVEQKELGDHKVGCAWVIMMLYKKGKCTTLQIDDLIDEFAEYVKGFYDYVYSLVIFGDGDEMALTYYNGFLHKKIKGS